MIGQLAASPNLCIGVYDSELVSHGLLGKVVQNVNEKRNAEGTGRLNGYSQVIVRVSRSLSISRGNSNDLCPQLFQGMLPVRTLEVMSYHVPNLVQAVYNRPSMVPAK